MRTARVRLKELEAGLQPMRGFDVPKPDLEQYVTSAHLAAHMVFTAETAHADVGDKRVLDLGCGCGVLSVACSLAGASYVLGVDVDPDALHIARQNLASLDGTSGVPIDLVQADVASASFAGILASRGSDDERFFDTVVMNPPFGTKNKGIDMRFLEAACRMSKTAVYSLHKTSTRKHVERKAKEWGFEAQVVAEMRYDLPKTMRMHKHKTLDIAVDFWRLQRIDDA